MIKCLSPVVAILIALQAVAATRAESVFTQKPDDARAVFLTPDKFAVKGDGVADDSDAIQQAIDQAQRFSRNGGVVFVPEGTYRLGKTIYVWNGVRVIGYGKNRPTFVLGANAPGFQEPGQGGPFGTGKYMVQFAESRQANGTIVDASEFTFCSAMSNIDFKIGEGNPSAVCVRFHVAQHSYLSNMDFSVGTGLAALEDIGNQAEDLHISGGKYGIISKKTGPAWQFLLMDSTFENQSVAAIHTQEVGFTMIRDRIAHTPVALEIAQGEVEQLYGRDLFLEDIKDMAVKLGDAGNTREEVTLENTLCTDVPHFVGGSEPINAPGKSYAVDHLAVGLEIGQDGREVGIVTRHKEHALAQAPTPVLTDIPALPPMDQWVNVATLGIKGDATDDPSALQAAVDKNRVLYFPIGNYRTAAPLMLKPDTVLIGFHPPITQISLTGQAQFDAMTGVIVTPQNGANIVSGLSVTPNSPRAAGVLWQSGVKSMLQDTNFSNRTGIGAGGPNAQAGGGGGRGGGGGAGGAPGNAVDIGPDLLVTNGGGGIIRDVWVRVTTSGAGLRVENTSTPCKVYQLSNEHHPRVEAQFHNVQNWEVYDLQTEEENPAGANAFALEVQDSQHLLFVDTFMYRVSRNVIPMPFAMKVKNSDDITFDNVKVFSQTRLAFDNAILDETSGVTFRGHDFTHLTIGKATKPGNPLPLPAAFAKDAKLDMLGTGFSNATSLTTDDAGHVYFLDSTSGKILRWNDTDKKVDLLATISGQNQPQVMGFVKPSSLLVAAFAPGARQVGAIGTVDIKTGQLAPVSETVAPAPGTALLLPVGLHNSIDVMQEYMEHRGWVYRSGSNTAIISAVENEHRGYFYAPDSNVALMAGGTGRPIMQTCQMAIVQPDRTFFITSEDDARTWTASLDKDYKLTTKLFAERGGNAVVTDADGNVYIAGGQLYVYSKDGKEIGEVEVPERATGLAFGGADKRTLYIGARSSIYAIRTAAAGN